MLRDSLPTYVCGTDSLKNHLLCLHTIYFVCTSAVGVVRSVVGFGNERIIIRTVIRKEKRLNE